MNPQICIQGAGGLFGGAPKPKPAVLRPPHTGYFPNIASYSVAEVVDLVSDGPIYGLVNKSGQKDSLFQGIYYNNIPIESYTNDNDGVAILSPSGATNTDDDWWTSAMDFYERFRNPSNNKAEPMDAYLIDGNSMFSVLQIQSHYPSNGTNSGKAVISFPYITYRNDAGARRYTNALNLPHNDSGNSPFNVTGYTGSYSTDVFTHPLCVSSNNSDLKKSIQESFYAIHDNGNFEIHHYNREDESSSGMYRSGTIISGFKDQIDTLLTTTGTDAQKVRYAFLERASKQISTVKQREFGAKSSLIIQDDYGNDEEDSEPAFAWSKSISGIYPKKEIALVFKIGDSGTWVDLGKNDGSYNDYSDDTYVATEASTTGDLTANCDNFVIDGRDSVKDFTFKIQAAFGIAERDIVPILVPEVAEVNNGVDYYSVRLTGKVFGVLVVFVPLERFVKYEPKKNNRRNGSIMYQLSNMDIWSTGANHNIEILKATSARKFNYASVMCEFRDGEEVQKPLNNFHYAAVDYEYQNTLYGPFRTQVTDGSGIFRIKEDSKLWPETGSPGVEWNVTTWEAVDNAGALFLNSPTTGNKIKKAESSEDSRSSKSYSNWNDDSSWNEEATPQMHMIENADATHVGFSLMIDSLKDTLGVDLSIPNDKRAGDPYPTVLHMQAEWGKIGITGESEVTKQRFKIIGLVQSSTIIDFGCVSKTDSTDNENFYENIYSRKGFPFIQESNTWDFNTGTQWIGAPTALFNPLELPVLTASDKFNGSKRFLRIYKVSAETNSVLLNKTVSLLKVTEIVKNKFQYPFSALVGSKFDSRYFSSIPNRSFDCRLKLVNIPSSYFPLDENGKDKRYLALDSDPKELIYRGDWNGTFKMGWTDNPAWIIYDLLTSDRYGLGDFLQKDQINIWELYKIGRFCDAVDDFGFFVGVSDLNGGLEPRYSCNIMFSDETKIFDAINVVASLFRGSVYFNNSEVNFSDDRPKEIIAMFNNANVEDGAFNYSNYRKDQQYNTAEVAYIDRLDDYKTKIEFVEDAQDIRNRGVSKTKINTQGVTSKAMARRIGKHLIHQSIHENQTVEFNAGLEALLCRPGDLITIDDEMKSQSRNFGRILDVGALAITGSYNYGWLTLDQFYDSGNYNNYINVYTPTGNFSQIDMVELASSDRQRLDSFVLQTSNEISGEYVFSGYSVGYYGVSGYDDVDKYKQEYYAVYTGSPSRTCYYSTGSGLWLFTRSGALYGKTDTSLVNQRLQNIEEDSTSLDLPDGSPLTVVGWDASGEVSRGILDDEIALFKNPQTTRFSLSDKVNSSYGCSVLIQIDNSNSTFIDQYGAIEVGSVYRFENTAIKSETYKVLAIRENNANSYGIAATKYDTSKYTKIDNLTREEIKEEYAFNGIPSLEDTPYEDLARPTGLSGSRASGTISVSWSGVANAASYRVHAYNRAEDISKYKTITVPTTSANFTYNDEDVTTKWRITVHAQADENSTYSNSSKAKIVL